MEVSVDPGICIGCGLCVNTAPSVFRMGEDGKAEAVKKPKPEEEAVAQEAADGCPVSAIAVS
jgi:ferredoxin